MGIEPEEGEEEACMADETAKGSCRREWRTGGV